VGHLFPGHDEVFLARLHRAIVGHGFFGQHLFEIDPFLVVAGKGRRQVLENTLAHTSRGFRSYRLNEGEQEPA
jgi:elongation factor P hydroxylase